MANYLEDAHASDEKKATIRCTQTGCDTTQDNWADARDDLLVCINILCKNKHRVMCRTCMQSSHKKSHTMQNDARNFVAFKKWLSLMRIEKSIPDHIVIKVAKSAVKGCTINIGANIGAYALADKAVWNAVKTLPQGASKLELQNYGTLVLKAMKSDKILPLDVMKKSAGSQLAICAIMFAIECGWNLLDYRVNRTIDYQELCRRNRKAGLAHGSSFIGALIGTGIGLMFGPIGAAIGSAIGGFGGDIVGRQCSDKYDPNEKQEFLEKAMMRLGYGKIKLQDLLEDTKTFNKKELEKRYHTHSIFHHPDGAHTSYLTQKEKDMRWMEFYSMYDALLVICIARDQKLLKNKKTN
eukprot:50389_1